MKKRSYKLFFNEIIEAMGNIEEFTLGLSWETFEKNKLVVQAVLRQFGIIGEAIHRIPEEIRQKYPNIPWKTMIGVRHIVIHEYFGVDLTIIWNIILHDLPNTKSQIVEIMADLKDIPDEI